MSNLTTIPLSGLEANVVSTIQSAAGPKISSITYPGDDTAALPAGSQTITINGSGFTNSSVVYIDSTVVGVVSYVNANTLTFITPAKAAAVYSLHVVNGDGATAISVPGISYSNVPVWSTSAGSIGSPYEANTFSVNLSATGDGSVTYAMAAGNSLPSGLSLSSNGLITGTTSATDPTTTFTFYVVAIDSQNQDTERAFSITVNKDEVTWSSPANGAAYSLGSGTANTVALSATSAAGKSITYSVQSGALPANVSISGSDLTGTPNTVQSNTSVVIRATAASTNRFADRTLYFTIANPDPYIVKLYGAASGSSFTDSSSFGHTVSVVGSGITGSSTAFAGGNSLYFNNVSGNDNYVEVNVSARNINFTSSAWTIGMWVRFDNVSSSRNLLGILDNNSSPITGWYRGNNLTMAYNGGMDMTGQITSTSANIWYHFRVTHGAGNQYIEAYWFNSSGVIISSATSTFNWSGNPTLPSSKNNTIGYIKIGGYYNQFGAVNSFGYFDGIYMTNTNLGTATPALTEPIG